VHEADDLDARVARDIARFGWHVVLIPPAEGTPGWAHTVGLLERFDHPELIIFGSDFEILGPLLNALGERVRGGARLAANQELAGVIEGARVALRAVAPKWIEPFLGNAAWHYRRDTIPALQCFWPDPGGHYPWQAEADAAWQGEQPLLFHHETHRALSEAMIAVLRRDGAL
jgi:hypothetical protein